MRAVADQTSRLPLHGHWTIRSCVDHWYHLNTAKGVAGDWSKRLAARERRHRALIDRLGGNRHMAERQPGFLIFYSHHYHRGRGVPRRVEYWHVVETLMVGYAT